jgi:hypothetical protein
VESPLFWVEERMAGRAVEFLAPPPFIDGNIVQFWVRGGNVSLENATRVFLEDYFDDRRVVSIKKGADGVSVFGRLWNRRHAFDLHGSVAWVDNTVVCCAKVDPSLLYDARASVFVPVIQFIR